MKGKMRKLVSLFLTVAIVVVGIQFVPKTIVADNSSLSNPTKSGTAITWDCVYFGNYPQSEVKGDDLTSAITDASYDDNGVAVVGGVKYKRFDKAHAYYSISYSNASYYDWGADTGYCYFRYEPIKWRVLSVNGTDAFLLADKCLDVYSYSSGFAYIKYAGSNLQAFVTDTFTNEAFSSAELSAINETTVDGETEKVYIASLDEVTTTSYGFNSGSAKNDPSRRAVCSDYAFAMGAMINSSGTFLGNCQWWLRTQEEAYFHDAITAGGSTSDYYGGYNTNTVRPVVHLNLGSTSEYSYAGTVTAAPKTYTISYNANGGEGSMTSQTAVEEEDFTIPECTFMAPEGMKFKKWAIGSADSSTKIAAGKTKVFTEDSTLYALWQVDDGTVVKNINLQSNGKIPGINNPEEPADETEKWAGTKVNYGIYKNSILTENATITFRVLDPSTTDYSADGTTKTMFLDSDVALEWMVWYTTRYSENANAWSTSSLREWLNDEEDGLLRLFSDAEKNALASSTRTDVTGLGDGVEGLYWCPLDNEKVFAIDAKELTNPAYGYSNTRDAANHGYRNTIYDKVAGRDYPMQTWMRSPAQYSAYVGGAYNAGYIGPYFVDETGFHAAPALNLKLDSILFTSASGQAKASSFNATQNSSSEEWNLTLKGGTGFAATANKNQIGAGSVVTVNVSSLGNDLNGNPVSNDYYSQLSAMLVDTDGNVMAYGKISDSVTEGNVDITVPEGIANGNYTLKVFAEKVNSSATSNATDYASEMASVSLGVTDKAEETTEEPTEEKTEESTEETTEEESGSDDEVLVASETELKIEGFQIRANLQETNIAYRTVCKAPNKGSTIKVKGKNYTVAELGTVYVCDPVNRSGINANDTINKDYTILDPDNLVSGKQYTYLGKVKYNGTKNLTYGYNVLDIAILNTWNPADTMHTYYAITMQGMNKLIANTLYVRAYIVATDGTIIYSKYASPTSIAQIANYLYVNNYSNNILAHNYLFDAILNNSILKNSNNIYYRTEQIEYGWDKNLFNDVTTLQD